jgi:AcrR family transcriptional regulator
MALPASATNPEVTTLGAVQPRRSNRAAPSETRARIMETAVRLYQRIGHEKTTVADIAHDLSMSPANVYRFFPSKQTIEAAVAGELLTEVGVAASNAARGPGSASERLRTALKAVERVHAFRSVNDHRLHELVVTARRENWSVVSSYAERLNFEVAHVISEGQAEGEFSEAEPLDIARCVLSAVSAHLDPLLAQIGTSSGRPTLDQMIDFCIGAFRVVPKEIKAGPGCIQNFHRAGAV